MKTENFLLQHIPALLIGEPSRKVYLYVHGKMGCKEEALDFAARACLAGYQVLAVDLPEHGQRRDAPEKLLPWVVVPELQAVWQYAADRWQDISLRATSIGAWLSMLAFQEKPLTQALLVSPVVDMENLITNMMQWASVTEEQLQAEGEVSTAFGETLSWPYLCWVREHPIDWKIPTQVLYAGKDSMTPRPVMEAFCNRSRAQLTVMEEGEHWFHTPEQLEVLYRWEAENIHR